MNTKNISKLLDDAALTLNIKADKDTFPSQKYTIIETCKKVFNFSDEATVEFASRYINVFSIVEVSEIILTEEEELTEASSLFGTMASKTAGAIGDRIRSMRGRQGAQQPPGVAPGPSGAGLLNLIGNAQNYFTTNSSLINNSPMIRVDKPGDTRYYVIQNLDTSKPEHQQILNDIVKAQTDPSKNQTATQINPGAPERLAALKYNKLTTLKPELAATHDKKAILLPALQQLGALLSKMQQETQNDLIVSQPEIDNLKQKASDILNKISSANNQPSPPGETAKVEADINNQIKAAAPTTASAPTGTPAAVPGTPTTASTSTTTPAPNPGFMSDYATQLAGSGTANTAAGTTSTPATTPAPVAPTTAAPMTATPGASVNASPAAQQNTWLAQNNPAKNTEANETLYKGYLAQGLPKDRAAYMSRYDETLPRTADIGNTQQPQQALTGATALPTSQTLPDIDGLAQKGANPNTTPLVNPNDFPTPAGGLDQQQIDKLAPGSANPINPHTQIKSTAAQPKLI